MATTKDDRKDYEQGVRDSHKGVLETAFNDIIVNHPDSSAYYKGRDRDQLDDDKDSGKK
jgi:hypothetical protein